MIFGYNAIDWGFGSWMRGIDMAETGDGTYTHVKKKGKTR